MDSHCLSAFVSPGWEGQRAIKEKWGSPSDPAPAGRRAPLLGPRVKLSCVSQGCNESSRFKPGWALQPVC